MLYAYRNNAFRTSSSLHERRQPAVVGNGFVLQRVRSAYYIWMGLVQQGGECGCQGGLFLKAELFSRILVPSPS